MPTYDVRCLRCGWEDEVVAPIAIGPPKVHICRVKLHAAPIEGALVQVIHAPVIHGIGASGARKRTDTARERDTEAYRRLRKDGVQPPAVKGSAELETRAGTTTEVERDMIFEDRSLANKFEAAGTDLKAEGLV